MSDFRILSAIHKRRYVSLKLWELHESSPCLLLSSSAAQIGIDHRVLDVGMSQSVLHEAQVLPCVEQAGGNRMPERVEVLFLIRELGQVPVALHPAA